MFQYIKAKITRQIYLALVLLISCTLAISLLSLWAIDKNNQRLSSMLQQEVVGLEIADDIKSTLYRIRSDSLEYILTEQHATQQRLRKEINEQEARLNKNLNQLYNTGLSKEEERLVTTIKRYSNQYISMLENELYNLVKEGRLPTAEKMARNQAVEKFRLARTAANSFMDYAVHRALKRKKTMEKESAKISRFIIISFIAIFIIAVIILTYSQKNIVGPIAMLAELMKTLANRDWSVKIPVTNRIDELGDMAAAIKIFKENGIENERLAAIEIKNIKTEAKLKVQSSFMASMSHELRTPMNAVLGFAQILNSSTKEPLSEKQKTQVGYIIDRGKKLLELIEQVLTLEEIKENTVAFTYEKLQLADLCTECLLLINEQAQHRNITINKKLGSGCILKADAAYLILVIYNLLSNAVKYNNEGGIITLELNTIDENRVKLSISDTGEGIAKNSQRKIFEAFNRIGREGSNILGAGVGLSLVKNLVEAMGGRTGVESKEGVGSTFWIELSYT